ncbi:DDB1- and CUL4-associated factor 5 isoform X1 [Cotesia glomerata]|uniref:DDB1- and CUL4-associated factor 5 isoform X1 n=1 Tax=Cotesia glomerata TaxID=32391 RepID=UPI001D009153|nr:DDB1- and CUL4-associated factor 5 isoform X1 [Cotesia glomerata]XP_044599119.1 DDB1- and CUL4-associated factor 5 isoform X1 [Cotesia glomerata]
MARPCNYNPLYCFLSRQIDDRFNYCKQLINARFSNSENLYRKDLMSHYGCVNAIEFSKEGHLLVSGGDDRRVLLWKVDQALQGLDKPKAMKAQHNSNIFCLGYDSSNSKIFSGGNDDQVIVHDLTTGDPLEFFLHEKPVYGLSVHPDDDNIFSSACDDGRVLVYDIRNHSSSESLCLAQYKTPFHSVMFNPVEPRQLATANAEEGVSMWDIRKPLKSLLRYGAEGPSQSCMNVRFNSAGTRLLALKRRLPPVLYAVDSPKLLCHFDQPGYYNSCTMKSCCFAGDDESYILSGSDDFNLYMWKIPKDDSNWVKSAHMILRGHRSIVNHVRYNSRHSILASSGVEKIIKVWSPFSLGNGCLGSLTKFDGKLERQRKVYTHNEYKKLILRSGQFMTHDYSHQSTREDPRMMAFFDSLVQREIEGWSSDAASGQRDPDDSEDVTIVPPEYSSTDSDDSTASDTQLMRSVLGAKKETRHKFPGGVAPERPFESPNRITRLIGSCRDKLMKLAALENGSTLKPSSALTGADDSDSDQTVRENKGKYTSRCKLKSKSRVKSTKQKQIRMSTRNKVRRKCTVLRIVSDAESDIECVPKSKSRSKELGSNSSSNNNNNNVNNHHHNNNNNNLAVDTAQPSTSAGISSRSSRYSAKTIAVDSDFNESNHSSASSDDTEDIPKKRRCLKVDNEKATSKGYRRKPERCKQSKSSRDKIKNNHSSSNNNNNHINNININDSSINNNNNNNNNNSSSSSINISDMQNEELTTPVKVNRKMPPPTPDSGIASSGSGSTVEKCDSTPETSFNGVENSDHERIFTRLECLKKKIDAARKGYRKRSAN